MHVRGKKRLARGLAVLVSAVFITGVGLACLQYGFAESVRRLSYDLPFVWRAPIDTGEVTLVYLDAYSARQLNQPLDNVWDRGLQAQLLDRLTADGARAVVYDIVFDAPAPDPGIDEAFAAAIQRHGKVVLGAALDVVQRVGMVQQERVSAPIKPLRKAAAGYGLLAFRPVDPDYGVRQIFGGTDTIPTATWKAAELLGLDVRSVPRQSEKPRWINFYGTRDTFASVNLAQALDPSGIRPGYFTDKIVFVGGRSVVGSLSAGRDEFATPHTRWNNQFAPGMEVHATILLNLLRNEWLTRLPPGRELTLIICIGMLGGCMALLRPGASALVALFVIVTITAFACWLVWQHRIWFAWLIPAGVQLPLALVSSVAAQYAVESRRRKQLRQAFGFYLSPEMADQIANSDFDLRPGGKLADVTVIFTDLENFTTISEDLDPTEVSEILTTYFAQTTRCILEERGTIIKYVGDAVFAAWGAPVDEPAHAIRAAEAACSLRSLTELTVRGKRLRTRVGVHSGNVLAGNLGSPFRFDYTMIGDAVNFASRLESLNKYLGTQILISNAVRRQLDGSFVTRRLGEFRVAGKVNSVVIHELVCRAAAQNAERSWIEVFESGLGAFRSGDFDRARELMQQTCTLRGDFDGPSKFYLRKIEAYERQPLGDDWTGIVELSEK
jgi:adenylate cyclase